MRHPYRTTGLVIVAVVLLTGCSTPQTFTLFLTVRNADGKYVGGSAVGHATEKDAKEAAEELKSVIATATYVRKKAPDTKKKDK